MIYKELYCLSHLFKELNVLLRFDLLVVDKRSVCTLQVYHVELDPVGRGAVLPGDGNQPVLEDRVLLAAAGMVQGDVRHLPVAPQQVGRLSVDVEDGELLTALQYKPVRSCHHSQLMSDKP